MPKVEKRILQWLDEHLMLIVLAFLSLAGIIVRFPMKDFVSGDSRFFLLPWYEEISANGLSEQVGNYNFLYQTAIYLMTKLPVEPLYAYKALSAVFDYALAIGAALLVITVSQKNWKWKAVAAYGTVLLLPTVMLNSCTWAQCDAIFCTFGLLSILALLKEKYPLAMVLLGLSFSFKLQAVFFLPIFLFIYYQRRKFSCLHFFIIPGTVVLTGFPMALFGRNILDVFSIYLDQTGAYPYMSMNYPSVWLLLAHEHNGSEYELLRTAAMVLTVAVLAMLMLVWIQNEVHAEKENLLIMAFLLCYTCVFLLPAMHERYGYPSEILAALLAVLFPKTIPLFVALMGITLCTYGNYLFGTDALPLTLLAVANAAVYVGYVWHLNSYMIRGKK